MELRRALAVLAAVAISCGPQQASPPATPAIPAPTPLASASAAPSTRAVLDVPAERPTLKTYTVKPSETDPGISATAAPHLVAVDPGASSRSQLFVFMGGLIVLPADVSLLVKQGAANGFHSIGLDYARELNVPGICQKSADEGCYEKIRLEVFDGEDRTPAVTVTKANSILNRLTKLVAHLAERYPADGWSQYLTAGVLRWHAIRFGGQSEGGAHATMVARQVEVARVCLLETPVDLVTPQGGEPRLAPWIGPARATPADRYYGFRHLKSSSGLAPAFALAWSAIGMDRFGPPTDTDTAKPPYGGSHHLTTSAEPIADGKANLTHRSVVQDQATPRATTGQPLFAPVWQYVCFS